MMSKFSKIIFFVTLAVSMSACQQHTASAPTPMTALPELERSSITVKTNKSKQTDLYIPMSALVERGGITAVFELRENKARLRMVRTGKLTRAKVQITSGLNGGEILLSGNLNDVFDGSPIRPRSSK